MTPLRYGWTAVASCRPSATSTRTARPDSVPKSMPIAYLATIAPVDSLYGHDHLGRGRSSAMACSFRRRTVIVPDNVHGARYRTSLSGVEASPIDDVPGTDACTSTAGSPSRRSPACAGVSTQTVSRVINKRPDVSPADARGRRGGHRGDGVPAERGRPQPRPSPVADARRHRRRPALLRRRPDPQRDHRGGAGGRLRRPAQGDRQLRDRRHRAGLRLHDRAPGRGDHLRGPADRRQHRDRPRPAPQRVAADRLPQVGAVAGLLDDRHRQPRRRAPRDRAPARARAAPDRATWPGRRAWHEAEDREAGWRDALRAAGVRPGPVVAGHMVGRERRRGVRGAARARPGAWTASSSPTTRWRSASCAPPASAGIRDPRATSRSSGSTGSTRAPSSRRR